MKNESDKRYLSKNIYNKIKEKSDNLHKKKYDKDQQYEQYEQQFYKYIT